MIDAKKKAFRFIVLMGLVSLCGDITYEGGRSISGPYLAMLGASAAAVGFFSGLGEFLGYGLRIISGFIADRTKAYWALTFAGYGLILAVPFLAFVHQWPLAVGCIVLERIGKAIRSPARDAILSYATKDVGRGFGFAIHEAMDQIGAVAGPVLLSIVFMLQGGYRNGLLILFIPAVLVLAILFRAKAVVGDPEALEKSEPKSFVAEQDLRRTFWIYMAFTFFSVLGFISFPIIAYHFKFRSIVTDAQIPLFYAIAMGVDGLAALAAGKSYDRIGLKTLFVLPLLTMAIPFFVFAQTYRFVLIGAIIWGIVLGIHETIMRAALADLTPVESRGSAYGIFNTAYGFSCLIGGWAVGFMYQGHATWIVPFVIITQLLSIIAFMILPKK
jgi:MFS family permease